MSETQSVSNADPKTPDPSAVVSNEDPWRLGPRVFHSRFLLGTGKFANKRVMAEAIQASGAEIITVALRRIDVERHEDNILEHIPSNTILMTNTSGARTAEEAVRIARLARAAGCGEWIKIEVIRDSRYLLPDNEQTVRATERLVKEGFIVLPYISPDLYTARALVEAGAAAVMPLGSLIGSNLGLRVKDMIQILVDEIDIPVIVDAGLGAPSHAAEAMEMGVDAVLVNTAVATAHDPIAMARAFRMAVAAGRAAYRAGLPSRRLTADPSSPLTGLLFEPS